MTAPFIAVDWGTTNRRIFLIDEGHVLRTERDGSGATTLTAGDYPAVVADIRSRYGELPMLLAGMVGSTIGLQTVPYVTTPAGLQDIVQGLAWVDARTAIVPGLSCVAGRRGDVMRGEEVQMLGAVVSAMVPPDALLCQPGTHCKWARLEAGRIQSFKTSMTGELFALLGAHSLLAPQLGGAVRDGVAFRAGVAEGARRDLAASLFGIRADVILGLRDGADATAFASGLLIGADVAARLEEAGDMPLYIIADSSLGSLYASAIASFGRHSKSIDSNVAFIAGISYIWEHIA